MSIVAGGRETGEHLVRHPGVDKVAFTGSTAAGRTIGAICGQQTQACLAGVWAASRPRSSSTTPTRPPRSRA
nr:aldehyde dehydrogenase family protein [Nocardioides convexus]